MIKMYGIKNCDTIKKAQKFLINHQVDFEFIDLRDNPINKTKLQTFVDKLTWEKLINKRSTTFRNLNNKEKNNITLELVLKNPTLIKRPVLVMNNNDIMVGFSEKSYLKIC
ncbi:Spx/MgsR family RNA polymerase-binding regulatory protein [Candidatus Ruthia endofausta]|uniref:Spx/MgsR family RNA polymerase-binding regulatory protein n=1 Tax=Candidatus Ruthia endofausta TaxID=2738852 RepID=A0A6N0HPB8_9GAMM|nr:Spx/MgsR family RNA polymerase-binding regulatory protein [Candidatus Ruthia endofausta]QKQ24218.1 Spx/MgsR family RNA polymerase-binding regulatory protein [Candidatus Ruthia endofausta]